MRSHGCWFRAREPITADVDTGGAMHRVTWRAGRLILHDHDLAAEEVLLALGGEPCVCLLVRDGFERGGPVGWQGRTFQRVMLNRPVGNAPQTVQLIAQARPVLQRTAASPRTTTPIGSLTTRQQLRMLQSDPNFMNMPSEHRDRILTQLRHTVAMEIVPSAMGELLQEAGQVRWTRHMERQSLANVRPLRDGVSQRENMLQSAVKPAIQESVRRSRAHLRSYGELTIKCWRQPPWMPPHIAGHVGKFGGFVSVSLSLSWLNRVWLRGLASVDGCLVLEVDAPAPAARLRGQAVRWERRAGGDSVPVAAACLLFKQGHEWHLVWC